jgi:hypothetical protein
MVNSLQNLKAGLSKLSLADYGFMALVIVVSLVDDISLPSMLIIIFIMYEDATHKELDRAFPHAYGWYFALSLVAALFTPKDILASYPILGNYFVDPVSSLVTAWLPIHKFSALSDFPEVTLLVFSLLVVFFPVVTAIYVYTLSKRYQAFHYGLIFQDAPRGNKFLVNLMWVYLMTLGVFLYIPKYMVSLHDLPNQDWFMGQAFGFMLTSRIGLGLVAVILMVFSSLFLVDFIIIHKEVFLAVLKTFKALKNENISKTVRF